MSETAYALMVGMGGAVITVLLLALVVIQPWRRRGTHE